MLRYFSFGGSLVWAQSLYTATRQWGRATPVDRTRHVFADCRACACVSPTDAVPAQYLGRHAVPAADLGGRRGWHR